MHSAAQFGILGRQPGDPNMIRGDPQHSFSQQYHHGQIPYHMGARGVGSGTHNQHPFPRPDIYAYGSLPQYPPIDPRGAAPNFAVGNTDFSKSPRRASEPAPVPAYPRGPPRKPKQSGHALWVGNLPPAATVMDLKDHFSRDATNEIESLFLISKSNCAFVNYSSEKASLAALNRFHDSRFHGVRLVCRLRRGSTTTLTSPSLALQETRSTSSSTERSDNAGVAIPERDESPVIVGQTQSAEPSAPVDGASATLEADTKRPMVPEKYFIIKSLTVQDLEASVRNGTWATQSHNEETLSRAYGEAENVYLIFSANKSGEYFGYARMASTISGEPVNLGSSAETEEARLTGTPQSIPTPATETAPKGRIIDDSARGTIFWEADHSDTEPDSPTKEGSETGGGQHWGRQFNIEWISTARLPFFRTRGLRNPWNANREVKIARDGTELEPSVGRRLVGMFHRPVVPGQGGPLVPSQGAGRPSR